MALPCLKQHTLAGQALQHDLAGGGIQLPEATCLGEREPQSGHLTKLSAYTLNQSFHRHTTFRNERLRTDDRGIDARDFEDTGGFVSSPCVTVAR
jgi:hypothetical protein